MIAHAPYLKQAAVVDFHRAFFVLTAESPARLPGDEQSFPVGPLQGAAKEGQVGRGVSKPTANKPSLSRQNVVDDLPIHVGETVVASLKTVGQALVIEAQQM